jgi:hypothetical protein
VVTAKTLEIREPATVMCSAWPDNQAFLRMLDRLRGFKDVDELKVESLRGKTPLQFMLKFRWGREDRMKIENRQRALTLLAAAGWPCWWRQTHLAPLITGWKERSARIVELKKSISQGAIVMQRETRIRERWEQ